MTAQRCVAIAAAVVAGAILAPINIVRADLPPGHRVDQEEVCLACHDLEDLSSAVQHAPAASGDCTACHNPHASRFDALLRDRPASVCVTCHEDLNEALSRPVLHRPVAEGRCVDCHRPHGGDHEALLARPSKELCRECHSALTEWEGRSVQHQPFGEGRCNACHDPHASEYAGLTRESGGAMCASCHPVTTAFTQRHAGFPVETASCRQCHDPHASARSSLFRANLHAPFEEGDCTICHAGTDSDDPFALVDDQDELCGACHEEQVEHSRTAAYPHVSAGGGRCTDCHNPHSGDGDALLKEKMQTVCLTCHDPGGATSGQSGRHVTHSGLDCTDCHAPHGGSEPLLLALESVELCGTCHTHEHGIRHPLGDETRDPRTGSPMTCLSCHGIHDSPHEMYLHASEERDLCLSCHKNIGGGK